MHSSVCVSLPFHPKYEIILWLCIELKMQSKFPDKLYKDLHDLAPIYLPSNQLSPMLRATLVSLLSCKHS